MDYKNISQRNKRLMLENAVLANSPQEIAALYKQLGQVKNSARALGLACRFRGLEYVEALVKGGADFVCEHEENEVGYATIYYWLSPLEMNNIRHGAYFINRADPCFASNITVGKETCSVLPVEQRVEIVKYLYQYREQVCLDAGELLFYAIMSGSKQITKVLKEFGVKFSENRVTGLTENGRSFEWWEFCSMIYNMNDEEYLNVIGSIVEELDGKILHYTDSIYWGNYNSYRKKFRLYRPDFFRFILDHFNQKKMNKARIMRGAIDQNSVSCLEICAEKGWLAMPRKRDEMIQYATESGKAECSAWLLEFKNRTADLAAEREKAEKKMMRELNANPNSVTELKKMWGYEKREDGTIVITRYKGKRTEVDVPEKIGNGIVTEIGERAFSTIASRLTREQMGRRKSITRITLPKTIRAIGKYAFYGCQALDQINIPDSVTVIREGAFENCSSLHAIELSKGITEIGEYAFDSCNSLDSIELPEGIREISNGTFSNCRALRSVIIPKSVEMICKNAFNGCTTLQTVVIPEGVTEIGQWAFANCLCLKSVVLPKSIRKIKNYTRKGQVPQTIFDKDVDLTVEVAPKSYGEKYCKRNNIPYCYSARI